MGGKYSWDVRPPPPGELSVFKWFGLKCIRMRYVAFGAWCVVTTPPYSGKGLEWICGGFEMGGGKHTRGSWATKQQSQGPENSQKNNSENWFPNPNLE